MKPITTAIQGLKGGQAAMARLLGVKPQAVNQWAKGRRPIPARHVLAIEAATGVSRHVLRPDVFGSADAACERPLAAVGQVEPIARLRAEVDSRMSKRALRAKLGLSSDKQLAKVLQLPAEQVSGWADEDMVPALPQVENLLNMQRRAAPSDLDDSDADRIVSVEVA